VNEELKWLTVMFGLALIAVIAIIALKKDTVVDITRDEQGRIIGIYEKSVI